MIAFNKIIPARILFLVGLASHCFAQTPSVLSSGNWFKFSVTQDGVVKIDYNLLRKAGVNPDQINPKKIKYFQAVRECCPSQTALPAKKI